MPHFPPALEALALGRLIDQGKLDPRALVRETLHATEAAERGMIVHSLAERAFAEAEAAHARAKSGTRRSPLDGIPIAWKDNIDVVGAPCEAGSRLLEGRRPTADATAVARAGRAGLVSFAKTGLTELAFSGLGLNPWTGTPRNAHDPKTARLPGGSSSGSAIAIASGTTSLAAGTDTGGSVRIPAAWNGLVGLKTTWGLIPLDGVIALSPSYDTIGPLARSVGDAAALYAVLAGDSAIDLGAGAAPQLLAVEGSVLDGLDPSVRGAYHAALERLAGGGIALRTRAVGALEDAAKIPAPVAPEAYALWGAQIEARPGLVYELVAERVLAGRDFPAHAAAARRVQLGDLQRRFLDESAGFDGVLLPTVAISPPPIAAVESDAGAYRAANAATLALPSLANRLGLCAITLPAGLVAGTAPLPFGLSLFAPPYAERRLLQIAARLERAVGVG
jgi:aspartyl-tRNA(Asn)/glutamyl-tRNA(Gln) amidotransferase subunit A